jgi:hypothetical protein
MKTFTDFIGSKYNAIRVDDESFERLATTIHHTLTGNADDVLDAPVTLEELQCAVKNGKPNKAPGSDGMSQEFFKATWEIIHPDLLAIIQEMHTEGVIMNTQTHGMMVCIPKKQSPEGQMTTEY